MRKPTFTLYLEGGFSSRFVTALHVFMSKGYVLPLDRSDIKSSSHPMLVEMDAVALRAAKHLRRYYPGVRTIGLDIRVDKNGKVWIIEANFAPMTSLFLK